MPYLDLLQRRSGLLARLRQFFYKRGFVEVETPLLAAEVIPEQHIEPMAVPGPSGRAHYLQASPELHMKQLVAAGMERIFQVTRSFRAGEAGRLHNPEFTLVEWYRVGDDMHAGMELVSELCQEVCEAPPARTVTYAEAFRKHLDVCPHSATCTDLARCAEQAGIAIPDGMPHDDRDEWLNLLLATGIESQLGVDVPEMLHDYPASQASLAATTIRDGIEVAERFELYWHGVELANGFHELTDAAELRRRLTAVNSSRVADGRGALPLPESLLAAMQRGLPPTTGCALGFDRLAMLALGTSTIADVMAVGSRQ